VLHNGAATAYHPRPFGGTLTARKTPKAPTRARAAKHPYSVHPGVLTTQKWIQGLKAKTGRSLDEWLRLIRKSGPDSEKERRDWLKSAHALGTNTAWWLAERSVGKGEEAGDPALYLKAAVRYVDAMFAGRKAVLRPLYDRLLEDAFALGDDVRACPCQTIVPLYRQHVFAQIKPVTNTRLDLGLALGDMKTPPRLIDTGGFEKKDRITRRIEIHAIPDIDPDVRRWLRAAYERDA
jgi:hypothetical protein